MAGLGHNLRVHLDVYVGMSETEPPRVKLAKLGKNTSRLVFTDESADN